MRSNQTFPAMTVEKVWFEERARFGSLDIGAQFAASGEGNTSRMYSSTCSSGRRLATAM
jgi:hypothetical protein